jgi:(1->4)-alpha-D-glucan 1-alpha-D-glucosylmutase
MSSEINVLGHQLNRLSERDRRTRDFTLNSLTDAIREIIACFPVYRTYVTDGTEPVSDRDRAYIRLAGVRAKRRNPAVSGLVFDYVRSLLLKEWDERIRQDRSDLLRFVMKFQQTTSPVTAKGIEDTANYIYNRLVSLNEVGGDPKRFGVPPALFHDRMRERRALWPHALSTTTTHDTKRSEDVRARINVLSEMPLEWKAHLHRWHRLNKKHATVLEGLPAPGRNEEYLLYQTLVGAWPLTPMDEGQSRSFCDRIQAYMSKALKEAKQHSSWMNPDQAYEQATAHFVEEILDRSGPNHFLEDFLPFQDQIARYGLCNSLSQVLVKITAPGIPDFYQGTETWDFSLVDPDNRRPVDFAARAAVLEELERVTANADSDGRSWLVRELMASCTDGRIKLYLTMTALNFRRAHAALFQDGDYLPMDGQGTRRDHVCAFARQHKDRPDQSVLTVVPRLVAGLMEDSGKFPLGADVWRGTVLPVPSSKRGSRYRNVLTGAVLATVEAGGTRVLPLADIFRDCPVALLERMA